jgi:transposase
MKLTPLSKVWLYAATVDGRKQMDALSILVQDTLNENPLSGQLFLFHNRRGDKLKGVWWDHNGLAMIYKRLDKGCFKFPKISPEENPKLTLTPEEFEWLLGGMDWQYLSSRHYPSGYETCC